MKSIAPPLLLFTLAISPLNLQAAQIPPFYVDAVVALGRYETRLPGQPGEWITEASGFLYGFAEDNETDQVKHMYSVYLVTNRHVLANHAKIDVRFNAVKSSDLVKEVSIGLKDDQGDDLWVSHSDPSIDISVVHLNGKWLRDQALQCGVL